MANCTVSTPIQAVRILLSDYSEILGISFWQHKVSSQKQSRFDVCRIVALDIATKTGIAILDLDSFTLTGYYIEGSPTFQIREILQEITAGTTVVIEDFS
jgi:hypothetical protein